MTNSVGASLPGAALRAEWAAMHPSLEYPPRKDFDAAIGRFVERLLVALEEASPQLMCDHAFDTMMCVAPRHHDGPHITSNKRFPHGILRVGAALEAGHQNPEFHRGEPYDHEFVQPVSSAPDASICSFCGHKQVEHRKPWALEAGPRALTWQEARAQGLACRCRGDTEGHEPAATCEGGEAGPSPIYCNFHRSEPIPTTVVDGKQLVTFCAQCTREGGGGEEQD